MKQLLIIGCCILSTLLFIPLMVIVPCMVIYRLITDDGEFGEHDIVDPPLEDLIKN